MGDEEAWARVSGLLRASGASDEEIDQARVDDVVDLLLADRLLVPADRRYTVGEVAAMTGVPPALIGRLWRAIGLTEPDPHDRALGDVDVEAVETFVDLLDLSQADIETAVHLARVIGLAMARIADAELSVTQSAFGGGGGDSVAAADRFAAAADRSLPATARLLEFVWRRHLQAATRRAMLVRRRTGRASPEVTVGFADMVGFTGLSQQLDERQLAELVSRFEAVAHDTVTALDGRVVKTIGDEVMFVADHPLAGARIGLRLAELYGDDDLLSDVRVGLAVGPVLVQDGDYYGPVVNLASRIVRIADPGTVLVSDDLRRRLDPTAAPSGHGAGSVGPPGDGVAADGVADGAKATADAAAADEANATADAAAELAFLALRPRVLKDVGRVQLWNLHRPGADPSPADRRTGRRWQRWNEVLRDLDAVRDRGEQIVGEARRSGWLEVAARARASGRQPDRGDPEGPQLEGPVDGSQRAATQVDEPT